MTAFTFDTQDFGRALQDLFGGYIVILTKANGAAIVLQDGEETDENGDDIIRFTIRPKEGANNASIHNDSEFFGSYKYYQMQAKKAELSTAHSKLTNALVAIEQYLK